MGFAMGLHWTKVSAGIQARAVVCPLSKIPGFLSGLVTMSSIVMNRAGLNRTSFSLLLDSVRAFLPFRACHHEFDRHESNQTGLDGM